MNLLDNYTQTKIQKSLKDVEKNMNFIFQQNEKLRKENNRLRSEHYKDEELNCLQEELNATKAIIANNIGILITSEEQKAINSWRKEHENKCNNKRYYYSYVFTPTEIGTWGSIVCDKCKEEFMFKEDV